MFKRSLGIALAFCCMQLSAAELAEEKSYGDWQYRCGEESCALSQIVRNVAQAPVMQISLFKDAEQRTLVRLALPLNVNLRRGAVITQGDLQQPIDYLYCTDGSCFAGGVLPEPMVAAFRAGDEGGVNFISMKAGPLRAGFSLKGFTAGHRQLLKQ